MTVEVIDLPVPLLRDRPALSSNQRLHWAEKARRTAMVRQAVAWRAKQHKIGQQEHVVVQLHFVPRDQRRRDPSNLTATQKPAVDGLVDAGVVKDDTPEWVSELMPIIHPTELGGARMWLAVSVGVTRPLSEEARRWIAEDTSHARAADAQEGEAR